MFQSLEVKPGGVVGFGGNQKEADPVNQATDDEEPEEDSTEAVASKPTP